MKTILVLLALSWASFAGAATRSYDVMCFVYVATASADGSDNGFLWQAGGDSPDSLREVKIRVRQGETKQLRFQSSVGDFGFYLEFEGQEEALLFSRRTAIQTDGVKASIDAPIYFSGKRPKGFPLLPLTLSKTGLNGETMKAVISCVYQGAK